MSWNIGQQHSSATSTTCSSRIAMSGSASPARFHSSSVISATTRNSASAAAPTFSTIDCEMPIQPVASSRLRIAAPASIAPIVAGSVSPSAAQPRLIQAPSHIATRMTTTFLRTARSMSVSSEAEEGGAGATPAPAAPLSL